MSDPIVSGDAGDTTAATVDERTARGKAARAQVPRSSHATWDPPPDRADPVDVLQAQAQTRVPELVPIRYGRMLVSPFTFYRGAAAIMAADLAGTPRSGFTTQLCGDAHLSNFGGFAAPDRTLVFDVNDFDETLPGPWEWDVKRLAASVEIAGRDRGFTAAERTDIVIGSVRRYAEAMQSLAPLGNLDVWYARLEIDDLLARLGTEIKHKELKAVDKGIAKSRTKDSTRALAKLTHRVDGRLRIVSSPPLIVPIEELAQDHDAEAIEHQIRALLHSYGSSLSGDRRHLLDGYRYVHMARKVVGVGSVGTRAWIILLEGRDNQDPLFLQAKEADASVLEAFAGPSRFSQHGHRVVEGQRLMQAASDIFLGWDRVTGLDGAQRDYYVRQLWDGKGSADIDMMAPDLMAAYSNACGWTLARAHARSGDRMAIAAYVGRGDAFSRAIATFASAYADQNERDYAAVAAAVKDGRLVAETGV